VAIADGKVMLGVVDPQFRSWNQIGNWLKRIEALRTPPG
jgi:hypothetical protein